VPYHGMIMEEFPIWRTVLVPSDVAQALQRYS
jgi:hypothetical protein